MNVHIKWGPKKIDLILHEDKPIIAFMQDIQNITGVPIARQRLTARRTIVKPDGNWPPGLVKDGMIFMLIGTAELPPVIVPHEEEEEINEISEADPLQAPGILVGLKNFGNTCYLNACLQTLRNLPLLAQICKEADPPNIGSNNILARSFCDFIRNFPVRLPDFIATLRRVNPMFAEIDPESGAPRQQDASECWNTIINSLISAIGGQIDSLFSIGYIVHSVCPELENIEVSRDDVDDRLRCFITSETRAIEMGISMDSSIEKMNEELGRNVIWNEHREITRLPPYLTIQMMRFTYKKDENVTAKIVRKVDMPMRLDTLNWLGSTLRQEVVAKRDAAGISSSNAGFYGLKAVLTHRGRSANSGHYITHVRFGDRWIRYDDEKVKEVPEEDIMALNGSSDWHTSYILIYEALE